MLFVTVGGVRHAVLTYPWPNQLDARVQGRFHVFLCLFKIASPDGERQLRTLSPPTIIFRPEKAVKGYGNTDLHFHCEGLHHSAPLERAVAHGLVILRVNGLVPEQRFVLAVYTSHYGDAAYGTFELFLTQAV